MILFLACATPEPLFSPEFERVQLSDELGVEDTREAELNDEVLTPAGRIPLRCGAAFYNTAEAGRLSFIAVTWEDCGCDPEAWLRRAEAEEAAAMVVARTASEGHRGEELSIRWGEDGDLEEADLAYSSASISWLYPDHQPGMVYIWAEADGDEVATKLEAEVPFCGELAF